MNRLYVIIGIGILFLFVCAYHVREGFAASLSCRDVSTSAESHGNGHTIYLDRLNVACGPNELLSQFRLQHLGGGWSRYNYKCCSVNDVSGPRGAQGERGPQGGQGPIGPVGPMGPKGVDGAKGVAGAAGSAGPAGPMGPGGVTGAKGDKGDRGAVGPMGPIGPMGVVGPMGPMGPRGATGMLPDSSYLNDSIKQLTDIHQSMVELAAQNA
jgi:hypothetical protein